jgi:hypothetical protein
MANEQNLHKIRSESEARELGRKGGIASGESRRQQKYFAKTLQLIVESPAMDVKDIEREFPDISNITNQDVMAVVLFKKALSGDLRAMEKVLHLTDQNKSCESVDNPLKLYLGL